MHSSTSLSGALAAERERELRKTARSAWKRPRRSELRIRTATDADMPALLHLAQLDSQARPPHGTVIVAEDGGELVAAMAIADGATIANPFRPTAATVALLRLRAEQQREGADRRSRRARLSLRRLRANASTAS